MYHDWLVGLRHWEAGLILVVSLRRRRSRWSCVSRQRWSRRRLVYIHTPATSTSVTGATYWAHNGFQSCTSLNVWKHDFQIQLRPTNAAMYIRLGLAAGCTRSTKRHVNKTTYVNVQHYAVNISSLQQINVLHTAVTFSQYDLVMLFIYMCTYTIDKYLQYSIKTQILR